MGDPVLTEAAHERVASRARAAGSATHVGEQRKREGKGLHDLVDPKGFGVIRRCYSWKEPKKGYFELLRGTAILNELRLDTTGSMGDNVARAMKALPRTYGLLANGDQPVLRRYDPQMITAIFGDISDDYVLCRSQAEKDERITEQMTMMVPEGDGGDPDEDPDYGLYGGAYLTHTSMNLLGLKDYDFTVTDACGRGRIDKRNLVRVFGDEVFDRTKENGHQVKEGNLPSTKQIVSDLLKRAHAFVLLVRDRGGATEFWADLYGKDRVIDLPSVELLPEVQAMIIGLTEGTLTLQSMGTYMKDVLKLSGSTADRIKRSVAGIPLGAQAALPNFAKLPLKGARFAKKEDIWPTEAGSGPGKAGKEDGGVKWL